MTNYDDEKTAEENIALALYEIAAALRGLMRGASEVHPIVEAAFIIEKGLGSLTVRVDKDD